MKWSGQLDTNIPFQTTRYFNIRLISLHFFG